MPTESTETKTRPSAWKRKLGLLCLTGLVVILLAGGTPSIAQAQIRLNLGNVDVTVLIKLMSELTGRTIIADEKVTGKVTVLSPREVSREEAFRILKGVLEVAGYSTIPVSDDVIKVIPSEEALRSNPPTVVTRPPRSKLENYQTRVIPLRYLKADSIETMIESMISPVGQLIVFRRSNSLVVSDYSSNVGRILEILAVFDREGLGDHVEVIPLKYSPVEAISKLLRELSQEVLVAPTPARTTSARRATPRRTRATTRRRARQARQVQGIVKDKAPVTIVADERILTGPKARIEELKSIIASLDVPSTSLQKSIHVHPLKNASAEELLPVLRELISGATESRDGTRTGRGRTARRTIQRPRTRATAGADEKVGLEAGLLDDVVVVADKGTNTLACTATGRDYAALKPVIEQLDIQRRQVHIEAFIAEIKESRAKDLGFDFQTARNVDGGMLIGRANTTSNLPTLVPTATSAAGSIASFFTLGGLAALAVSGEKVVTPDGQVVPAHLLLFRALESDTDIDVLSRPNIRTRDNQEAEIVVGQNVPFIVAQQADRTDPNSVFSQIERRDIGIILRIKPQISEGDAVKLDLFQELTSIAPAPQGFDVNSQGLVLRKRSARTSIVVQDGRLVAIGGLISDDVTETTTGVPFLSKIPIIGQLFRFDSKTGEKTNILILLIPRVIRDQPNQTIVDVHVFHEILSPPIGPVSGLRRE
jgi:general secretion pathway protein D